MIPTQWTHDAIITSLLRRFDVIMTLFLRRVSVGHACYFFPETQFLHDGKYTLGTWNIFSCCLRTSCCSSAFLPPKKFRSRGPVYFFCIFCEHALKYLPKAVEASDLNQGCAGDDLATRGVKSSWGMVRDRLVCLRAYWGPFWYPIKRLIVRSRENFQPNRLGVEMYIAFWIPLMIGRRLSSVLLGRLFQTIGRSTSHITWLPSQDNTSYAILKRSVVPGENPMPKQGILHTTLSFNNATMHLFHLR